MMFVLKIISCIACIFVMTWYLNEVLGFNTTGHSFLEGIGFWLLAAIYGILIGSIFHTK